MFLVSEKIEKRAVQQCFATGDLLSKQSCGRTRPLSANQATLLHLLQNNPRIYNQVVQEMYEEMMGITSNPMLIIRYANRFSLMQQRMH